MATPFELVIFDCDGVLVDSEPIANRILAEQLQAVGLHLDAGEVMRRFVGRTRDGCLAFGAELLNRPLPAGFGERWDTALFDALRREVRAIEGVLEVISGLRIPYCVASNGNRDRLRLTLEAAGLLALFEGRIFCAADVAHPKPAPDLFLHAAAVMGAPPERCVVIEDTPTGARAATAAGMKVLGYAAAPHADREALAREGATLFERMEHVPSLLRSS
ncbi:MAG: HAD family hydrolase [Betaproteobacteria bacterium]